MIRFVDLRRQGLGERFAFWNTVTDQFVSPKGDQAWSTWAEFEEAWRDEANISRFKGLCPSWAFEDEEDDVLTWMSGVDVSFEVTPMDGASLDYPAGFKGHGKLAVKATEKDRISPAAVAVFKVLLCAGYAEGFADGAKKRPCNPEVSADQAIKMIDEDGSAAKLLEMIETGLPVDAPDPFLPPKE